jgi:hypothetical protein
VGKLVRTKDAVEEEVSRVSVRWDERVAGVRQF